MMNVYLIRHGRTFANEKRLYCGHTDLPLSKDAAKQIKNLKEQGVYPKDVDLFFTSGMLRAKQTIQYIYGCVYAEIIPEMAEFNFGQFEMKSYEDLKGHEDYIAWISDDTGLTSCPDGENNRQFINRVLEGYSALLKKASKADSVLLVSHGGVIAGVMDYLFPNICNFYEWQPEPARGYMLIYDLGKLCGYKKI